MPGSPAGSIADATRLFEGAKEGMADCRRGYAFMSRQFIPVGRPYRVQTVQDGKAVMRIHGKGAHFGLAARQRCGCAVGASKRYSFAS